MSQAAFPFDPYVRAQSSGQDLVRDLNNVREAALGVAPAYRWDGPPLGTDTSAWTIDNVPPSWLVRATGNFAPASDGKLWDVLAHFAVQWASKEGEAELAHLDSIDRQVGPLKVGQLVRLGPSGMGSLLNALAAAAREIGRTIRLTDPANAPALHQPVEEQLRHFDPCEAYDALNGEIEAAARESSRRGTAPADKQSFLPQRVPGGAVALPSVDEVDIAILRALASKQACRLSQLRIASLTQQPRVSRATVSSRMPRLEAVGLAGRPAGPRAGYVISSTEPELLASSARMASQT